METTSCPGCQQRDALIASLQEQLTELQQQVARLREQVNRNSSNSSLPPSANPLDAPKPVRKKRTGRKPGGQPGHEAHLRQRLPADHVVHYRPAACQHCQAPLAQHDQPDDPEPLVHQVAELPKVRAVITEHQAHGRRCPCCDEYTWAKVPDAVRAHCTGPSLTALMSLLSGVYHVSRRGVEEIVETIFEVPVALGTVVRLEQEVSAALAPAHAEAVEAVRQAEVKNVDETGWKQAGKKRWLWAAATTTVAAFVIGVSRGAAGLAALLGEALYGILCSDRWGAYNGVPASRRQLCWAHLTRDFRKCQERGGESEAVGRGGLRVARQLFRWWNAYRGGGLSRSSLQLILAPVQQQLRRVLERGRGCADSATAAFCVNLLEWEESLWTFVRVEGVEPTNNHIERQQRPAVLWRKNSFGCHSAEGCRFVERMLTVVQTLRLRKESVLGFLHQSVLALRAGRPAPKLLLWQ